MSNSANKNSDFESSLFLVKSNPGLYALLLGSGVSYAAQIPTGWGVMCALIKRYAEVFGETVSLDEAFEWYKNKFQEKPNYSLVLEKITKTASERSRLLRSFFEPKDKEARKGIKLPTDAHKAIAQLMKYEFIKVVITTNFDRLLEKALFDINVSPIVLSTESDVNGFSGLMHEKNPVIIKVNGDYLDTRIKNTSWELSTYDDKIEDLISSIFSDYGLIVSGWSGVYDKALVKILNANIMNKYSCYWVNPNEPAKNADESPKFANFHYIKKSSDEYFTSLAHSIFGEKVDINSIAIYEKTVKTNIANYKSVIFGREQSILKLTGMLGVSRVITLIGPAGIGKTVLAIKLGSCVIADFKDGVWFVDLSFAENLLQMQQKILEVLDVKEDSNSPLLDTIIGNISNKKILFIFDNCERLTREVGFLINKLLGCESLKIVTTSREKIGIESERLFDVKALSSPECRLVDDTKTGEIFPYSPSSLRNSESGQLFLYKSRAQDPSFDFVKSNCISIAQIIDLVDGIPLGIELAASMIRSFSPEEILRRLENNLLNQNNKEHGDIERQSTLYGAVNWSYSTLTSLEMEIINFCSLFENGFSLSDLEEVCKSSIREHIDYNNVVSNLIDKSFLQKKINDGKSRYFMIKFIKYFCRQQLSFEKTNNIRGLIADHFIRELEKKYEHCVQKSEIFKIIDSNLDNIKNCFKHLESIADYQKFAELFLLVREYLSVYGYFSMAKELFLKIEMNALVIDKKNQAECKWAYSNFSIYCETFERSKKIIEEAKNIFEELDDENGLSKVCTNLGTIHRIRMEYDVAIGYYQKALDLARKIDNIPKISANLINIAVLQACSDSVDTAKELLEEAISLLNSINDRINIVYALMLYGEIQEESNELQPALRVFEKALKISKKTNNKRAQGSTHMRIGLINYKLSFVEDALISMKKAYSIARSTDNLQMLSYTSYFMALFLIRINKDDKSISKYIKKSLESFDKMGREKSVNSVIRLATINLFHTNRAKAIELLSYLEKLEFDDKNLYFNDKMFNSIIDKIEPDRYNQVSDDREVVDREYIKKIAVGEKTGLEGLIDSI